MEKKRVGKKKKKKRGKDKIIYFFSSFNAYKDIMKQREKENEYLALIE